MLVLASNSPRRKELLELGGWSFTIHAVPVDESPLPGEAPQDHVLRLAQQKAQAALSSLARPLHPTALVAAADTVVSVDREILGKPQDAAQAEDMLRRLRGRLHQVYTAVAVLRPADGSWRSGFQETGVLMRAYSDQEMYVYIASGDPFDKAGAYAIQHGCFRPVEALDGCYANVMGLPVCLLSQLLEEFGAYQGNSRVQACRSLAGRTPCAMAPTSVEESARLA